MTAVREWSGREARALREAMRLSLRDFAARLGIGERTVSKWEARGSAIRPRPAMQEILDTALRRAADDVRTRFLLAIGEPGERLAAESRDLGPERGEPVADALVESPSAIVNRIRQHSVANVSDELLDALELYVVDVVDRYEQEGPARLAPDVVRQRQVVHRLLDDGHSLRQRARLMTIAGRMSGQLGYMAVNLGRFGSARAYGIEAFLLADLAGDEDLKAWVRGTQSLTEYYAGNYDEALSFAQDGQRYAGRGRQAVRLLVNGEARALGKAGQLHAVDRAVGRSFDLLASFQPEAGMTPCISFGLYSEARVASNAATAYLSVSNTSRALEHIDQARFVVDGSSSLWSRALVRLDTATALVRTRRPDAERAVTVAREAMRLATDNPITSIRQRVREFAVDAARWTAAPVAEFIEEARLWLRRVGGSGHEPDS